MDFSQLSLADLAVLIDFSSFDTMSPDERSQTYAALLAIIKRCGGDPATIPLSEFGAIVQSMMQQVSPDKNFTPAP